MQTSSEIGTPKHAKPTSIDTQPSYYTPEPNPEAAKQLHFPQNAKFRKSPEIFINFLKFKMHNLGKD
jgi:hypothetical protein